MTGVGLIPPEKGVYSSRTGIEMYWDVFDMYLSNFQIQDKYLNTCIEDILYWDVFEKKANTFKYKIHEYIVFKYILNTIVFENCI